MPKQAKQISLWFILAATLTLLVNSWFVAHSLTLVALTASGTLGLAHGSLDWAVAKHWGLRTTIGASVGFILAYLMAAAGMLVLWQFTPELALISFLLLSLVHFASDWRQELGEIGAHTVALAIIGLPTLNFYPEVQQIFAVLLAGPGVTGLTDGLYDCAWVAAVLLGLLIVYLLSTRKHAWLVVELVLLMLIGLVLPPVVYFSVYFCFLHAPKHWHSMRVLGIYSKLSAGIYSAVWPTLCCVVAGLCVITYSSATLSYPDAVCKTVFVGLAALTLPHLLLIEIYGRYFARQYASNKAR